MTELITRVRRGAWGSAKCVQEATAHANACSLQTFQLHMMLMRTHVGDKKVQA